jgi:hypothetical protein
MLTKDTGLTAGPVVAAWWPAVHGGVWQASIQV